MTETVLLLLLFLLPLAYSPGPGNLFFAASGARFGLRATLSASLGYHVATWLVTAAIGFGAMGVIEAVPGVFAVIRMAGALYVLRIAAGFLWVGGVSPAGPAGALEVRAVPRPAGFRDGVVLLVLNPKAYVIIGLMFSQFLGPAEAGRVGPVLAITTVFTLNNLVAFTLWTVLGVRLGAVLARAGCARALNLGFGAMLVAVAVWMLLG